MIDKLKKLKSELNQLMVEAEDEEEFNLVFNAAVAVDTAIWKIQTKKEAQDENSQHRCRDKWN